MAAEKYLLKYFKSKKADSKKVLLIHGAYMSGWNFEELAKYLQDNGLNVYVITLRGHFGENIDYKNIHYTDYISDLKEVVKKIGKCIVCGISMGGMLASELCMEDNVDKLILLSTPYKEMPNNLKYILLNLKVLPQLLSGRIRISAKDLLNTATESVINDVNKHATFEPAQVMRESGDFKRVAANVNNCKKSVAMAYGEKDYTVNQEALKSIPKSVKVKIFEGMAHLLIHEKNKSEVFRFVLENI